jgi:signal transduction histidine kinase
VEELKIAIITLIIIVCILVLYMTLLQRQIRSINRQLDKRLAEKTRQPVSLEFINSELNGLASNINKCFKAEESLRLEAIREEKKFKELIANISHDLRTPLTAIKGYQQLMENSELTLGQREKLKVAQKYAEELGRLIEHFFEYSYLVNTEIQLNPERINLTNLVAECLATSISSFEKRGLSVQLTEVPAIFVLTDKEMTIRIVQNLIRNCIAHSSGNVSVALSASVNAVIAFMNPVDDASEIDIDRIFDRFYTADRARSKTTGLGLSIVKLLAEQMGGAVSAALKENELTIMVELPLYK